MERTLRRLCGSLCNLLSDATRFQEHVVLPRIYTMYTHFGVFFLSSMRVLQFEESSNKPFAFELRGSKHDLTPASISKFRNNNFV